MSDLEKNYLLDESMVLYHAGIPVFSGNAADVF